ncbi:MAG: hypothetical protein EHM59_04175 [Betaproteobacteria bacterium]|nr:MAG: hypothetical protein EHM59_04175 [Betaproteobacteria bacterium]
MRSLLAAIVLTFAASAALAHNCPNEMKAIDAALPGAKLDAAKMSELKKLRAEGEKLHKEGKHTESMAALGKAKGMLGIK